MRMTNDQLLAHIQQRRASNRVMDLGQLVYFTFDQPQYEAICTAATEAGCVYSVIGPDENEECTIFVQGSPAELEACTQNAGKLLPDGN